MTSLQFVGFYYYVLDFLNHSLMCENLFNVFLMFFFYIFDHFNNIYVNVYETKIKKKYKNENLPYPVLIKICSIHARCKLELL